MNEGRSFLMFVVHRQGDGESRWLVMNCRFAFSCMLGRHAGREEKKYYTKPGKPRWDSLDEF